MRHNYKMWLVLVSLLIISFLSNQFIFTEFKLMDGFHKKETKNKKSIIDDYYDTIKDLLNDKNRQVFFYKRVL